MKRPLVITRLSIAIAAMAIVGIVTPAQFGLLPDRAATEQGTRARLTEALAISLSLGPLRQGPGAVRQHLELFGRRNGAVRSLGVRRSGGTLLATHGPHEVAWPEAATGQREGAYVVPLFGGGAEWGQLEVCYRSVHASPWLARFPSWLLVAVASGLLLFLTTHLMLRRVLRQLDPSRVIPARVRETLDTFVEGVLLLDNDERIVLANEAFAEGVGRPPAQLVGVRASELPWTKSDGASPTEFPWRVVTGDAEAVHGAELHLAVGENRTVYSVNSAPVRDDEGKVRGAMAAFADITLLEQKKEHLARAMNELRASRDEIVKHNEELAFLATRDPLTGCLNRRSFFESFESEWRRAERSGAPLACVMVDIDFFKSINDTHGHSTGDEVLRETGGALRSLAREHDLVARYGGEEFCMVLPGATIDEAHRAAERVRAALAELAFEGFSITASLGVSSTQLAPPDPQGLIDQADKCLYVAKRGGRNQTVRFDHVDPDVEVDESKIDRTKPVESPDEPRTASAVSFRSVSSLLATLAYRDPDTAAHSTRVADLAVGVARQILAPRDCYLVECGALLHDVGKIGVPDAILHKPAALTDQEWQVMRRHDRFGTQIVRSLFDCDKLTEIVEHHHHRFDTPEGAAASVGARIVAIADAYDAMVSDRPYRVGMPPAEALEELRRCAEGQFDPELVELFTQQRTLGESHPSPAAAQVSPDSLTQIGRHVERLVLSLDQGDHAGVAAVAAQVRAIADSGAAAGIAESAAELATTATESDDLLAILESAHGLLAMCRNAHRGAIEEVRQLQAGVE